MLKNVAVLLLSLLIGQSCFADSPPLSFEGIWQDRNDATKYYAIHENNGAIVLIDLPRLERTGTTLSSAYMGKVTDLVLTRLGPAIPAAPDFAGQVSLQFTTSTEGMILPICEVCTVVPTLIRKVF